jgi:hypothetical protein
MKREVANRNRSFEMTGIMREAVVRVAVECRETCVHAETYEEDFISDSGRTVLLSP